MDAETLKLKTHEEEEAPSQVMATGGDTKVVPVAPVCKTLVVERGNDGNGQHEVKEENSGRVSLYFNPSDSFLYIRNGPAIGIAMSPTEEVREIYLKKMFMMPPNHEFYCPSCNVCINKVLFCTTREPLTHTQGAGPQVSEPDPDFEGPVRCSTCFSLLFQKGKQFITGLVSRVPPGMVSRVPPGKVFPQPLFLINCGIRHNR
ncbi:hypothetical protein E2542_SST04912 [Spatholobus suberectus]|nr:hypothetical protein E2542_SST04912 [Spatholobus suberectus]